MNHNEVSSVLFVCMGNICRSPSAEAVFRQKARAYGFDIEIESAGTIANHVGEQPDPRSQKAGQARGYDFTGIRARKVVVDDFQQFSLILAMDNDNLRGLMKLAPEEHQHKVKLFLDYADNYEHREVPDPYYGGSRGFELVLDLIEDASDGLLNKIMR
ncbi:low molecular weight phosphotyrosine protein phosphatase [Thalassotalea sp. HSM 43]|uniref:low molecular weight protein-tyrosine-phosphatase n=1 Tax=Thalassotalea sp. HSM 43 TaxID=2552945 RepID=UPI0010822704|nr:low molecular weight protein-tyrosine-phosphatase [Thalassotalea sp. HSM 43]QBY05934.1 low molecular weight phosphotyrosine protein phosphatase [Thalassotalea sp. HSM 43]